MAKVAGPLVERVWKMQLVHAMIKVAISWIQKVAIADHHLIYVPWQPGKKRTGLKTYEWQPLLYTAGDEMNKFELELRWTHGETTRAALSVRPAH